ncbi:MAG: NADAR family protein [Oscillospiraceae bacterium]|nr:NADAR family protein [Oscillospiraceae bacterium]
MRRIVCFHNPDEMNGYLSNWYMSDFVADNIKFTSMEQYMMYKKAQLFNDTEIMQEILSTDNVGKIKMLGRSVKNYDEVMWNGVRQIVVYEGLYAKFNQNESLRKKLLATENDILAECAVSDCIWGIGLAMNDEKRLSTEEWRGQNLLGFAIMQVREKLSKQ